MITVVLDTNVIISAAGWEAGSPNAILNLCLDRKLKLLMSPAILEEVREVVLRKKFDFIDSNKKNELLLLLTEVAEVISPKIKVDVCKDKSDNKFIELAIEGKANYILSGDQHLLSLKSFKRIKIVTPKEFLNLL